MGDGNDIPVGPNGILKPGRGYVIIIVGPGGKPTDKDGKPLPKAPDGNPVGPDGKEIPVGPDGRLIPQVPRPGYEIIQISVYWVTGYAVGTDGKKLPKGPGGKPQLPNGKVIKIDGSGKPVPDSNIRIIWVNKIGKPVRKDGKPLPKGPDGTP